MPPSLAAAIAWQESGFNNGMVSSANARGVMQVMPGTWNWVQSNLAGRRLDPSSAADNVQAGSLYLRQLLRDAGGDPATAIAGYYQGQASVRDDRDAARDAALRGQRAGAAVALRRLTFAESVIRARPGRGFSCAFSPRRSVSPLTERDSGSSGLEYLRKVS